MDETVVVDVALGWIPAETQESSCRISFMSGGIMCTAFGPNAWAYR